MTTHDKPKHIQTENDNGARAGAWFASAILVGALLAVLVVPACAHADEYLAEIKRGVDNRGMYDPYVSHMADEKPALSGRFKGNCSKFAVTYAAVAQQAGYRVSTSTIMLRDGKGCHAIATVKAKDKYNIDQTYVLDNLLDEPVVLSKYKYGGSCR